MVLESLLNFGSFLPTRFTAKSTLGCRLKGCLAMLTTTLGFWFELFLLPVLFPAMFRTVTLTPTSLGGLVKFFATVLAVE
jgi:hypothetical protein